MKKIMTALLIGLMIFSLACSQTKTSVVAKIDGEEITREAFEKNLALLKYNAQLRHGENYWDTVDEATMKDVKARLLEDMISEHLALKEAKKAGFGPEESEMQEFFKNYMERTFGPEGETTEFGVKIRAYLDEHKIDDGFLYAMLEGERTIQQYIMSIQTDLESDEARKDELLDTATAQVKAGHILVPLDKKDLADELYAKLKEDVSQFAELAQEHSTDGSAAKGGDLGYFVRTEMIPVFNDAAFDAEIGVVTEPVESQYGYHLILVSDKRNIKAMEAAEEEPAKIALATRGIMEDTIRREYFRRLDEWKAAAKIERFELDE